MSGAEILLLNPKPEANPRKKRKGKMPAGLKRYWAGKRRAKTKRKSSRRPRRNPSSTAIATTPARKARRKSSSTRRHFTRARRGVGRVTGRVLGFETKTILPASVGAIGALGIDMLWGYIPGLSSFNAGSPLAPFAPLARIAAAVGLGFAARMLVDKKFGNEVMVGAVTVTAYDLGKEMIKTYLPNVQMNAYVDGMSYDEEFEAREYGALGYYSAAPVVGEVAAYVDGYDEY